MKRRALWAAGCSALFLAVYPLCNALTALRGDVGVIRFDWEGRIPFLPWTILPYWSIDLFFVASFFLCRDREELRRLGWRLSTATVAAAVCFLLFPLRLGDPHPDVGGFWAPLYTSLWSVDQPFNQFPSLHVAFAVILGAHYSQKTRGPLRLALAGWFMLIALSTLTTRQHHAVDLAGGLALGLLCLHPIRIGLYYSLGSVAAAGLALRVHPVFAWPALSLATVAAGYYGLGPAVYRLRFLTAPCVAGQWLSWRHYRTRSPLSSEVSLGVLIGARPTETEAQALVEHDVRAVLDLAAELPETAAFRGVNYLRLPVLDLTAPTAGQLDAAVDFIDRHSGGDGMVYVHCKAGYSRSAAVVAAWLLRSGRASTPVEAVDLLRSARPGIVIRPEARRAVDDYFLRLPAKAEARV